MKSNVQDLVPTVMPADQLENRYIWNFGQVLSTQDVAFSLAGRGKLGIWDSVRADLQLAGRGQLRRNWRSPEGNVYASLRLPSLSPFDADCAAPAVGALVAQALRRMGCPVQVKWPNDIVLETETGPAKLGGILLEERGGVLVAGIGINLVHHPEPAELRAEKAFPATSLAAQKMVTQPPHIFWYTLVRTIITVYKDEKDYAQCWRSQINAVLLWRGALVELVEHGETKEGILSGVGPNGGVLLLEGVSLREYTGGSLRLASSSDVL